MAQSYAEHLAKTRECIKRLHEQRVTWGLCIRCGKPLNGVKTFQCEACLAKERERRARNREAIREKQRQRVADHRARGLCVHCDDPVFRGGRCEYHWNYYKMIDRKRRALKKNDKSDN